jgi:hypothetical protein
MTPHQKGVRPPERSIGLHPMNDELPGDLRPPKQLDRSERDGVPAFLDRRKANDATEASYVDLVGGGR